MNELFEQKIRLCNDALTELERIFPTVYNGLFTDPLLLPAIERHFQILVDAAVDCNNILLEAMHKDKADSYFGTFTAVRDAGIISPELADSLAHSVGLRNALVHRYETIDRVRMYESMKKFIARYRVYLKEIVSHS